MVFAGFLLHLFPTSHDFYRNKVSPSLFSGKPVWTVEWKKFEITFKTQFIGICIYTLLTELFNMNVSSIETHDIQNFPLSTLI